MAWATDDERQYRITYYPLMWPNVRKQRSTSLKGTTLLSGTKIRTKCGSLRISLSQRQPVRCLTSQHKYKSCRFQVLLREYDMTEEEKNGVWLSIHSVTLALKFLLSWLTLQCGRLRRRTVWNSWIWMTHRLRRYQVKCDNSQKGRNLQGMTKKTNVNLSLRI